MNYRNIIVVVILAIYGWQCAHKPAPLPPVIYPKMIYPFEQYPFRDECGGLQTVIIPYNPGGDLYANPRDTVISNKPLPLCVLKTGILPVRVILRNVGDQELRIDANQILGWADSVCYLPYSAKEAVDMIINSSEFRQAIKGSRVEPVIRSVLGGQVVLGATRGAVNGGATGATQGALNAILAPAYEYENALIRLFRNEYTSKALDKSVVYPGYILDGMIFLPSRANITEVSITAYDASQRISIPLRIAIEYRLTPSLPVSEP